MTETSKPTRPQGVEPGHGIGRSRPHAAEESTEDMRVAMVLDVLRGNSVEDIARAWRIESSLLHRWVQDFVVAGTGAITNRPDREVGLQRDRFLASFAHELRTPLAVARGWAMTLAEGGVPEEDLADSLKRLTVALTRLSDHIFDVELTASVSLGRLPVNIEEVKVADLCRELPGDPFVRRGADLTVYADPRLLSRVIRDLWMSAHREPDPESVFIDVVDDGPWRDIRVVRDGAPISPMILQALFDPFGTNDDTTGVTLGLYLARALIVAQGGILGAEG